MSRLRMVALLILGYLVFIVVFPRFEGELLNRITQTKAVRQSETLTDWIDGMTSCECSQARMTCNPNCRENPQLDGSSPRTIATGFFASTFVLTPFVPRHLVFIETYGKYQKPPWVFGLIATVAMFTACTINFVLGACMGLVRGRPSAGQRWARSLDRWGPGVFLIGCIAPLGFPIGLASLYLGWRHTRIAFFLPIAAVGCACHILVLIAASGPLLRWWSA